MKEMMPFLQQGLMRESTEELTKCNEITARFGLTLSKQQMVQLEQHRRETLQHTGRVEFGNGILGKLVMAFCDSPYLEQRTYEKTLCELQELFYQFKGLTREQLTDDELLTAMRLIYDEAARGSLDYLSGVDGNTLYQVGRTGSLHGTALDNKQEDEPHDEWE